MISVRFLAFLSTLLLVVGALLVGEAIHGGVVTGEYAVTSPYVVLRAVLGIIFIALGYRFRTPVEEYVATPSSADRPDRTGDDEEAPSADAASGESGAEEFDPSVSPLGDEGLEHVETDDEE